MAGLEGELFGLFLVDEKELLRVLSAKLLVSPVHSQL